MGLGSQPRRRMAVSALHQSARGTLGRSLYVQVANRPERFGPPVGDESTDPKTQRTRLAKTRQRMASYLMFCAA